MTVASNFSIETFATGNPSFTAGASGPHSNQTVTRTTAPATERITERIGFGRDPGRAKVDGEPWPELLLRCRIITALARRAKNRNDYPREARAKSSNALLSILLHFRPRHNQPSW